MSTLATSVLLISIAIAVLLSWWRTILKVLAVTVLILASVGVAEVISIVTGGLAPS